MRTSGTLGCCSKEHVTQGTGALCNAATAQADTSLSLSEDEIADFMLNIPVRLARYGLSDPGAFVTEMRERMEMARNEN